MVYVPLIDNFQQAPKHFHGVIDLFRGVSIIIPLITKSLKDAAQTAARFQHHLHKIYNNGHENIIILIQTVLQK